jgi:hypothetical protein
MYRNRSYKHFSVQIKTQRLFNLATSTLLVSVKTKKIIFNSGLEIVWFFSFEWMVPDPYLEYTSDLGPGVKMVHFNFEKGHYNIINNASIMILKLTKNQC